MATLQELQTDLAGIYKSLEEEKNLLLRSIEGCNQQTALICSVAEGTIRPEYNQMLGMLQNTITSVNKAVMAIDGAEKTMDKWAQGHLGMALGIKDQSFSVPTIQIEDTPSETSNSTSHETTAETLLDNCRNVLISLGFPAGKLLDKFLEEKKEELTNLDVSNTDSANSDDSLAIEYSKFCLEDVSTWIEDINPNYYSPFILPKRNPYRVNCGSCAFAVETRLSGGEDLVATRNNIASDGAMEEATGKTCVYMPREEIEQYLRYMGAGSHLIVGINRGPTPDGTPQSGHWFNAFFDGEKFYTIDGQCGEILDWPYDYGYISEWCALI